MPAESSDALFQLNLILWCTMPSAPPGIRPIFAETGYRIWSIAPRLTLSTTQLPALRPIGSSEHAEPEVILHAEAKSHVLVIECKGDSFGPDSSNAAQLIVLMAVVGSQLRDALGIAPARTVSSDLIYVVPAPSGVGMYSTLAEIARRIAARSVACSPSACLELEEAQEGINVVLAGGASLGDAELRQIVAERPRILTYRNGQSWRPLYLVPIDPSVAGLETDVVGREVLEQRMKAALFTAIGGRLGANPFTFDVDAMLKRAIPVWDLWAAEDAKKSLRRFGVRLATQLFGELQPLGVRASAETGRRFRIEAVTPEVAGRARKALVRSRARDLKPDSAAEAQIPLFEDSGK